MGYISVKGADADPFTVRGIFPADFLALTKFVRKYFFHNRDFFFLMKGKNC